MEGSQSDASEPDELVDSPDLKKLYSLTQVDKRRVLNWRIGFLAYIALFVVARLVDRPYWWILPAGLLVPQTALFTLRQGWVGVAAFLGIRHEDRP